MQNGVSKLKLKFDGDRCGNKRFDECSTQLSQTPNISYLTSDHLGSPRINTNAFAQVISRHDYQPFGEEIQRASYGADEIKKKFTGYEKDTETNLDYAQARMYGSQYGRFSTVDPTLLSVSGQNPQTWNRYVYVMNNPVKFTDPLGLWAIVADTTYKKNKDGTDKLDKKGQRIVDRVTITAIRTKETDDSSTLADQLGLTGKDAGEFSRKAGDGDNIRLSETGGIVGRVFSEAEKGLTMQEEFRLKNPTARDGQGPEGDDCSETASRVAFPGSMPINGPGVTFDVESADELIQSNGARSVQESNLRIGDIARWAKDGNPTHFANFIFRNDDGVPLVFSKSGAKGSFEIAPINGAGSITQKNGSIYGTAKGINKKDTGYYRP